MSPREDIIMLSQPAPVSMGEAWFDIAQPDPFWFVRRFEVLRQLWRPAAGMTSLLEIGCGNGVLQRQFEDEFQLPMDGADLHLESLQRNISRRSKLYCYDIFERRPELAGRYDGVVLFDVIEHLNDPQPFLTAALPRPARRTMFDSFAGQYIFRHDAAVGHKALFGGRPSGALRGLRPRVQTVSWVCP